KVPKSDAERARKLLAEHHWLANEYSVSRLGGDVLFPILPSARPQIQALQLGTFAELFMPALARKPQSLSEALEGQLTDNEMEQLVGSFDIVGDIAVLEIPPALQAKRQALAQAVLSIHPQVRVVAAKTGGTGGPYRIRPVEVIAGPSRTLTICKESGCSFAIDLNAAYYTPRWSAERLRVARAVKDGENVLVAFAGVGPYAVVIEKHARPAAIAAIELNPQAALLMRRNIELNHCHKIEAIEGDVARVLSAPRWKGWADRALMPHPTEAEKFLPAVLPALREGGILHYYCFAPISEPVAKAFARLDSVCRPAGWRLKLNGGRIVRPYSAALAQVVLDLEVRRAKPKAPKAAPRILGRKPAARSQRPPASPRLAARQRPAPFKANPARRPAAGRQGKRS
ncbi:MAG: class I SAM-dependent methyltransferase family protein, partial [Candidatus Micrarchaeota archaeon]|nr:class I SAM-dependent methyltransferase family protein [Candidatus Micrarchaeota archaeon]